MGTFYILDCKDILIINQYNNDNIISDIKSECQQPFLVLSYTGTTQVRDRGEGMSS